MTEQTDQTTAQPDAIPARIELEDFIEAVTRGVTRALAAQDDIGGYAFNLAGATAATGSNTPRSPIPPNIIIGIIAPTLPTFGGMTDTAAATR